MRQHAFFFAASLFTLAQIVLAVLIDVPANRLAGALAFILGVMAALFIYWPLFTLVKHGRIPKGASYFQTTAVVDRGPYTIVRHPQYLGYILINLTFMLCNPSVPGALLGGAAILCFYLYAGQEDDRLRDELGTRYQDYMRRVPSFNPLLGLFRLLFE